MSNTNQTLLLKEETSAGYREALQTNWIIYNISKLAILPCPTFRFCRFQQKG